VAARKTLRTPTRLYRSTATQNWISACMSALRTDTIERVKAMIEEQGVLPAKCQRLRYDGKDLQKGATIGDHGVDENDAVVAEVRRVGHRCSECAPAGGSK
jgi:hypothetical protein